MSARDNFDTLWFQTNANKLAQTRARQAISQTGAALPSRVESVTGSLVTVSFECTFATYPNGPDQPPVMATLPQLTLPKAEAQWCRLPTQIGDFGITIPADTFLGTISGMGTGTASLDQDYGNMGTLVWVPIGNKNFSAMPNANSPWLNGPAGAVVSDTNQTVVSIYDAAGKAISHVVPSSGGLIGLGALANTLAATRAVPAQADLQTLANNIVQNTLQKLSSAIGAAAVSSSLGPGAAAFSAILSASNFVTNISGINPSIPSCSSIVRVSS